MRCLSCFRGRTALAYVTSARSFNKIPAARHARAVIDLIETKTADKWQQLSVIVISARTYVLATNINENAKLENQRTVSARAGARESAWESKKLWTNTDRR